MSSAAYVKRHRLDRLKGISHTPVPIAIVQTHLTGLLAAGVSGRAIADTAGVSPSTICRIVRGHYQHGPQRGVHRRVARRILAVTPTTATAGGALVLAVGARRRVQALLAIGWRLDDIRPWTNPQVDPASVFDSRGPWVRRATHEGVAAAYRALSMRPGPSALGRARAAARGLAPPLAWDEDTIDDPAALPLHDIAADTPGVDEVAVRRACAGDPVPLTRAERWTATRALADQGMSDPAIAARLGVTERTVLRDRQMLGIASTWRAAS